MRHNKVIILSMFGILMHDIFLSYSRKDSNIMQRVKQSFQVAGFTVWTDEGIEIGTEDWQEAIEKALQDTSALVCICSPDSKVSRWVKSEVNRAEKRQKSVFLILARGDEIDSLPLGYDYHQFTDIRNLMNYEENITRLIQTVKEKLFPKKTIQTIQTTLNSIKELLPPPFDWCEIPQGNVTIEGMNGSYIPKDTRQTFTVPSFFIAKYPITNAQFAQFIEAGGYLQKQWWSKEGLREREKYKWTEPRYWKNDNLNKNDYPVVGVSWYEAVAFCMWLSEICGEKTLLPTEQQWQRAAQGDDGRIYPWGNEWDCKYCNNSTNPCDSKSTTSVTAFEGTGNSPFDVVDLSGNAWEWCLTEYETGLNIIRGATKRVLKGGACNYSSSEYYRVDYRIKLVANFDNPEPDVYRGFRICVSL